MKHRMYFSETSLESDLLTSGVFFSFGSVPPRKVDRHILTKVMAYEEMKKQKREYFEKIQRFGP